MPELGATGLDKSDGDGHLPRMAFAPFASDPAQSRGRRYPLESGSNRGQRDEYQRDRDRIVHSIAFRRLRHKTQVFVAPDGVAAAGRGWFKPLPALRRGRLECVPACSTG